jgi:enoyl-CoA hydratase
VSDIVFERRGAAGVVVLDRPHALNALTHAMVRALTGQLAEWAADAAVTRVIVTAAGGRAFCAGGDVRELYDLGRAGRHDEAIAFLHDEYRLDAAVARYPKPYVSLIDGLVMGGGVGISIHGSHRVAGDSLKFAMPEVGIGFFPDVGATWFLPRLPGQVGTWLALTGASLGADDATTFGVGTHRVRSARLPELAEALCGTVPVDAVLGAFAEPAAPGPMAAHRGAIDQLFGAGTVEGILAALAAEAASDGPEAEFARDAAAAIRGKSPTSLKIALSQLRRGKDLDFDECMRTEYRIVSRIVKGHDFYEGIRAVIVDKDRTPRWQPGSLVAISDADVAAYFAPLAADLALR